MIIKIVGKSDRRNPTEREGFWAYKLDSFIPRWLKRFFVKVTLIKLLDINRPCQQFFLYIYI